MGYEVFSVDDYESSVADFFDSEFSDCSPLGKLSNDATFPTRRSHSRSDRDADSLPSEHAESLSTTISTSIRRKRVSLDSCDSVVDDDGPEDNKRKRGEVGE